VDEYTIEQFRRDVYDTLTPPHQPAAAARAVKAASSWEQLQALLDDFHEACDSGEPLQTIDPLVINFVIPDWVWDYLCGQWNPAPVLDGRLEPGRKHFWIGDTAPWQVCMDVAPAGMDDDWMVGPPVPTAQSVDASRVDDATVDGEPGPSAIPRRADPREHPVLVAIGGLIGFAFSMSLIALILAVSRMA